MKRRFYQEVFHRLVRPWNSAFSGYFILIVILFAGFGVGFSFFSAIKSPQDDGILVAQNIATYFMAILAASVIDLNISWEVENKVSFLIYSMLIFIIGVVFLVCTYLINNDFAFLPAGFGCILAWIIWVLANAYNEKLNDENFYNNMRGKGKHGKNWD